MNYLEGNYNIGDVVTITHKLPEKVRIGRKLYPYYGGNCKPKKDIKLKVDLKYK